MARRSGTRVSRGTPRKKIWARQVNTGAAIAAGAGETFNADLLSPLRAQLGLTAGPPGLSVIRVRGAIDLVETTGQARMILMGIRVYNRSGADAGAAIAAVDGPASDPHADWLAFNTLTAGADQSQLEPRVFDARSMRKLEEVSDSLIISFQAPDELAAQLRYSVSVLVALP